MSETADALVVFGITGDLARRMTMPALYRLTEEGLLTCSVIGVGRRPLRDDELREQARAAVTEAVDDVDEKVLSDLLSRLEYVGGDAEEGPLYERLGKALGDATVPVFYLATPPSMFLEVAEELAGAGLAENARLVVEKPFGSDLASARELNERLTAIFPEDRLYRIDHFLGKEPVQDILYLRFANALFEPVWSREDVDSIQITLAEDFGVEERGSFYDKVGAIRDVVQNHLLQVLALAAMEPPSGGDDAIPRRRLDVFRAMPGADPDNAVRGQYEGYREIEGVSPKSDTETFVALKLEIENWRWAGIPIFIRAGKGLPVTATEVVVRLQRVPQLRWGSYRLRTPGSDDIVLRVGRNAGVTIGIRAKTPGKEVSQPVSLDLEFEDELGEPPEPYERLLADALRGDSTLFPRWDVIEETWRIVQPLLDSPPPIERYAKGTWGPASADLLAAQNGGWRVPARQGLPRSARPSRPRATSTSETSSGAKSPCSTTPGVPASRSASAAGSSMSPTQSARTPPSGVAGASRSVASPSLSSVAARPNERSSSGIGGRTRSTTFSDETITTKRSAAAATIFSRVWAPPPPFTTHELGVTWSAPSTAMSRAPSSVTSCRPSSRAAFSVAGDVAMQRMSRRRSASARRKYATVVPVPRPTCIPSSTSSAAASAASCFSRSSSVPTLTQPYVDYLPYGMGWSDWAGAVEVEPSIYAADFSRLGEQLGALVEAGAKVFHFDAGDGHFIPEITIGPVVLASISPLVHGWGGVLDCHLMVEQPVRYFEPVAEAGGDSVTFHVEACSDPAEAVAQARSLGLGVGIAFSPDTPVEKAAAAAEGADLVLCMSIQPGYSGQAFMPDAAARIERLRALVPDETRVQVDGGINRETISTARAAGADLLVAGSAVFWHDDPASAYRALTKTIAEPARG